MFSTATFHCKTVRINNRSCTVSWSYFYMTFVKYSTYLSYIWIKKCFEIALNLWMCLTLNYFSYHHLMTISWTYLTLTSTAISTDHIIHSTREYTNPCNDFNTINRFCITIIIISRIINYTIRFNNIMFISLLIQTKS